MSPALLVSALLIALPADAGRRSPVFAGDWAPATADEVERFCLRYDTLDGDLRIGPDWQGADLSPLSCLSRISGKLWVEEAPALTSLAGLDGLASTDEVVFGAVVLRKNPALETTAGLGRLRGLRVHTLLVTDNPKLAVVEGLPPLLAGGRVEVKGNRQLRRIDGPDLDGRGALDAIVIEDNVRLNAIRGFGGVREVEVLRLRANPALTVLAGPRLQRAGAITVVKSPALPDLDALAALQVADNLNLGGLSRLTALPDLLDLSRVGKLVIGDCPDLANIDGLVANPAQPPVLDQVVLRRLDALPEDLARAILDRAEVDTLVVDALAPPQGGLDPGLPGWGR
jgi:hypothetical protein